MSGSDCKTRKHLRRLRREGSLKSIGRFLKAFKQKTGVIWLSTLFQGVTILFAKIEHEIDFLYN